jgi:Ala-tRNA(Pro) deacylase
VVLAAELMAFDVINAHPLVNTMTTSVNRDGLVKFLEATGHPPRILRVSDPQEEAADRLQSEP